MGRVVTRDEIATRCRELAGQENVGVSANRLFVSPGELNAMIDAAMRDLYDLLVRSRGHEYYLKVASTEAGAQVPLGAPSTVGGAFGYTLPADWYETRAVRAYYDSTWRDLAPFDPGEVSTLRNDQAIGGARGLRYRHGGNYATSADNVHRERLLIAPTPTFTIDALEVVYLPTFLTQTGLDAVTYNGVQGWEDYAVFDVVAQMLAKEESDPTFWLGRREKVEERIRSLASSRDAGRPQYIQARDPLESRGGRWGSRRGWS